MQKRSNDWGKPWFVSEPGRPITSFDTPIKVLDEMTQQRAKGAI